MFCFKFYFYIFILECRFIFKEVNLDEIQQILKKMKNKSDIDFISPSMLLDGIPVIGEYMLKVINGSLKEGVFPDIWKKSRINICSSTKNKKYKKM